MTLDVETKSKTKQKYEILYKSSQKDTPRSLEIVPVGVVVGFG